MSKSTPLQPHQKGQKRRVNWFELIGEVVKGETAVTVAARFGVPAKTLQQQLRKRRKAHEAADED